MSTKTGASAPGCGSLSGTVVCAAVCFRRCVVHSCGVPTVGGPTVDFCGDPYSETVAMGDEPVDDSTESSDDENTMVCANCCCGLHVTHSKSPDDTVCPSIATGVRRIVYVADNACATKLAKNDANCCANVESVN